MICSYMGAVSASMALLSVLLFVQSRIQQKSIWMFFSLGAYATSIFLKEDALVLPGVLFALDWIYFKKRKEDLFAKTILDLVPFFIFAVVYLGARYLFVTPGATFGFWNNIVQLNVHQPGGWVGWLGALFLVFKSYFILWIWPNPLTIYHVISLPEDIRGWVLFCCEWALLIIFGLKIIKNKLMAFGLAWFFIFSLLICNLIPIGGMFSERLIYLPSVGLAWITAVSLGELKKFLLKIIGGKILFTVILFVGAIGLSFQSYVYSQTWRSDFTIWEHARQVSPYRPYPYSHLAKTFYDQGDFRTAAHFFKRAAELTGVVSSTAVSRQRAAGAYGEAKEYDLAIREYKTLLAREPKLWDVYFALGWTYLMSGDDISAEKTFKDTLVKKPDHGWSYFGLAELAFKKGDDEKGRNLYTLALNHSSDEALMKTILKSLQGRSKQ